jgi:quinoprotein dehydrogenase-associated probable ABC transporter substrate-binding protein
MRRTFFQAAGHAAKPLGLFLIALSCGAAMVRASSAEDKAFRVCADPNNLPFSNEAKAGFENKLADLVAAEFGERVVYTWHAERRGFVRETLKAKACDVVMGLPAHYDPAEITQPYYRSAYVFVSRADRHLGIASIKDPRLRQLKIGVQLIGDDGFNTPPPHALAAQGIIDNLVGYTVYGDYRTPNPPAAIVTAVEHGDVDIAAVWGPLAGYFAKQSPVPLTVVPIADTESFAPLQFAYDIGMGVRKGDHALRDQLNEIIARKRPQITALLQSYGVPLVDAAVHETENTGGSNSKN